MEHNTTTVILRAADDRRAPPSGGVYSALFAHSLTREALDELATSKARTVQGFLKKVRAFQRRGGYALWKGGEVKPGNRFKGRLDTISSAINTGNKNVPTAAKIHQRLVAHGGFALIVMFPINGYSRETLMMHDFSGDYGMEFDNYGRDLNCTKPVKKRWLPSTPALFEF